MSSYASIVLPRPLRGPLIYRLPEALRSKAAPGCRVKVPLGTKKLIGCLLAFSDEKPSFQTKDILEILDEAPLLSPEKLKLLSWASAYYLTPIGEVLRHLLPPRLLHLKENSRVSGRKTLEAVESDSFHVPDSPALSQAQKEAIRIIHEENLRPLLLHGVTGSGKTEIYIEIVQDILKEGGQALILVPEIGLTPQILGRFRRLSHSIAAYHSGLTEAQRYKIWEEVRSGKISIVIATRSGFFLPFPKLKLMVIDEEHDTSYKQEERFCYHARDLALWLSHEGKVKVVLGSATPSIESLYRVETGKIRLVSLPERPVGTLMPTLEVVDRRSLFPQKDDHPLLSERLLKALHNNLKKKEQSLLFMNRRGFSPFVLCSQCGFVPRCEHCTISLTLHKSAHATALVCHYCDATQTYQTVCPQCHKGSLKPLGFGTERIEQDLLKIFPSARIARMDRDSAKGKAWLKILERMKKREIDILIGTQMITKGHDYPFLTLVGILDADLSLHLPDFRATERTFQLITQVAGRAGRAAKQGHVIIQTFQPENAGLVAALHHDTSSFYQQEIRHRNEAAYPPFRRLIEIRLAGANRDHVMREIEKLGRRIQRTIAPELVTVLGPAPCLIEKVRGLTRWHLLLKTSQYAKLQPLIRRLLDDFENDLPSTFKVLINVDPVDMM